MRGFRDGDQHPVTDIDFIDVATRAAIQTIAISQVDKAIITSATEFSIRVTAPIENITTATAVQDVLGLVVTQQDVITIRPPNLQRPLPRYPSPVEVALLRDKSGIPLRTVSEDNLLQLCGGNATKPVRNANLIRLVGVTDEQITIHTNDA